MDSPNYRISIQGVNRTITALERFAPDLKKQLDKEVKGVLSKVVTQAREHIPFDIHPSGWARGGYSVQILSDCTSARTRAEQDFFCQNIFPLYGGVLDSKEAIRQLTAVPA